MSTSRPSAEPRRRAGSRGRRGVFPWGPGSLLHLSRQPPPPPWPPPHQQPESRALCCSVSLLSLSGWNNRCKNTEFPLLCNTAGPAVFLPKAMSVSTAFEGFFFLNKGQQNPQQC